MTFPILLYPAIWICGLAGSALSCRWWIRFCLKKGLVDDPGHRKIHTIQTPLAGGLAVLTGITLPLLFALVLLFSGWLPDSVSTHLLYGFKVRSLQLFTLVACGIGMLVLGLIDDAHELKAAPKFIGQCLLAFCVAASGIRITLFVDNLFFSYAVTLLWILTMTNAMNFMDNMNGLCGGLGALAAFFFGCAAAMRGHYLVSSIAFLCSGAMSGFLPFNYPQARAFLGDSGSHLIGFLLATLAILPHFYSEPTPDLYEVFDPLLILAIPLVDLVWVVVIRLGKGQPFYVGDTNHLSHRLVARGFSKPRAVVLIWTLAMVTGLISLL